MVEGVEEGGGAEAEPSAGRGVGSALQEHDVGRQHGEAEGDGGLREVGRRPLPNAPPGIDATARQPPARPSLWVWRKTGGGPLVWETSETQQKRPLSKNNPFSANEKSTGKTAERMARL